MLVFISGTNITDYFLKTKKISDFFTDFLNT